MKKLTLMLTVLIHLSTTAYAGTYVARDRYKFVMRLYNPRVYNNTQSTGYRKYHNDLLVGDLYITYRENGQDPTIEIANLVNRSQIVGGSYVTFKCYIGRKSPETIVNMIGSNYTGIFKTASVAFHLTADPSYNKGDVVEDNTIEVAVAGYGTAVNSSKIMYSGLTITKLSGQAAGSIGCGCTDWGHVSPTRVQGMWGPTSRVNDRAAIFGRWTAALYSGQREFTEEEITALAATLPLED